MQPLISLVVPAWNEQDLLPRLLDSVALARDRCGVERVQVIVADNDSADDTASIATAHGCTVVAVAHRCIAAARNGGAAAATGEIVAFADADFCLHPETFRYIEEVMRRPGVVGGATGLTMERWSLGMRLSWMLILPPLWALGLDAGVWFFRRADFESLGGFDESVRAGEDVRLLRAMQRLGRSRRPRERLLTRYAARRMGLEAPLVVNSARKFDQHGDWHLFLDGLRGLPKMVLGRRALDEYVERYWYEGRGPESASRMETEGETERRRS